jgi:hypothetical protein
VLNLYDLLSAGLHPLQGQHPLLLRTI